MTKKTIILVDDDKYDQEIIKKALIQYNTSSKLIILNNGEELLQYLKKNQYRNSLILLDLNMPKISGKEVLEKLTEKQVKNKTVIIFTTSEDEKDIQSCYNAGVKSFITKPSDLESYNKMVKMILDYWFNDMVKLPKNT